MIELKTPTDLSGLRVTIMGLGLHGGGNESVKFLAKHGAQITITDLRSEEELSSSIIKLKEYPISKYTLGKHEEEDFANSDIVIKNPAVKKNSPYLKLAKQVETDISLFCKFSKTRLIAITGSKGKSTVSSAIFHCLKAAGIDAFIGGNITISPLSFIEKLTTSSITVLELSSWQLADLIDCELFKPKISIITNILHDHMNAYSSLEDYIKDKKVIFKNQDKNDYSIFNNDDYGVSFLKEAKAKTLLISKVPSSENGAWLENDIGFAKIASDKVKILGKDNYLPGTHQKLNLLFAGLTCLVLGVKVDTILKSLKNFSGIEHRLELFFERDQVRWYNDSAATIPDACLAATQSFKHPIILITGGTDKNCDFYIALEAYKIAKKIILLKGSGTEKIVKILQKEGVKNFSGPFSDIRAAVVEAKISARPNDIVILSPGCASFEMFNNEFDRGLKFKQAVYEINSN